jgi:protein gp37
MSIQTGIEWTDATWNPVRGCSKISAGCKNCYAEAFAERWRGTKGHPYEHGFDLRLVEDKLFEPLTWAKSRMIFVNSMSDLFHEGVPTSFIVKVFQVMKAANWHIFQVLTKRPERLQKLANSELYGLTDCPNIWLGVSVENRSQGLPRVNYLRRTPASTRFLSIEPLLEDLGKIDLREIDWVIVGGESGAKARPMSPEWVRSIRDQCAENDTSFFFKQWGGRNKKLAGRSLDGEIYNEFPCAKILSSPSRSERLRLLSSFSAREYANI